MNNQVIISKTNGDSLVDSLSHSKTVNVKLSEVDADEVKLWDHANLYISSTAGEKYTVSLKDISYKTTEGNAKGYADVHKASDCVETPTCHF